MRTGDGHLRVPVVVTTAVNFLKVHGMTTGGGGKDTIGSG